MNNNDYFSIRANCPACGSSLLTDLYQAPYDRPPISDYLAQFYSSQTMDPKYLNYASYHLISCKECGLIFQKEIPNTDLMKQLYEQWIDPQNDYLAHQKGDSLNHCVLYAKEVATLIEYFQKSASELKLLDFGMGWGRWALMAKAFGCISCGHELSADKMDVAVSNGIDIVSWEDIPNGDFDFINTEQVFEHLADPLNTLIHLKKGLKDRGILKISVPTAYDIRKRLKKMDWNALKGERNSLNPVAPLEHINCFSRASLILMAEKAGMEEVVIPMRIQYIHTSNWKGIKRVIKNLLQPIYRNILKRQNYILFKAV